MPSVVLLVLVSILVADVFWWRRADRRARRWRHPRAWRLLIAVFMGGQMALVAWIIGGRFPAMASLGRPTQPLNAAAYLWHLLVLPASWIVVAVAGILLGVWRFGGRLASRTPPVVAGPVAEPATRRQFLGKLAVAAPLVLTGTGVAYTRFQLREFRVRPLELALPGLPPELDGLRIALVSDLHVGTFTHGETVKQVVEETSRLNADLVLLPGDLINSALADLSDALDAVNNMQSRHGAFLSVGNHDLIEDGSEFVRRVRARATLLDGESHTLLVRGHPVQLLGLPWSRAEDEIARSVRNLARQLTPGAFPILLAHHPHAFDTAAAVGIPLTLSGHTHGGQLMLAESVGFGPLLYRYWSGPYRKPEPNGATLVVSNGVGNWFPLRTGAPAEIIDLTLRTEVRTAAVGH